MVVVRIEADVALSYTSNSVLPPSPSCRRATAIEIEAQSSACNGMKSRPIIWAVRSASSFIDAGPECALLHSSEKIDAAPSRSRAL